LEEIRRLVVEVKRLKQALERDTEQLKAAQEFVTLANTVWTKGRDGRAAARLAEKRMGELAGVILPPRD
jgi:hypothetical protein